MNGGWWYVSGDCCSVVWVGQAAVVTLPAEVDVTNADQVRESLLAVVNQGAAWIVADMGKTTFCDSTGVSALVRTFKRATASGGGMRLVVDSPAVHRVLGITGVDLLMPIYPSVAASLGGQHDRPGPGRGMPWPATITTEEPPEPSWD
jgi:anti-sigma B factor antagonist